MTEQGYSKLQWGMIALPIVAFAAWLGMNVSVLGFRFWTQPEMELDYLMGVVWWCVLALGILIFAGDSRQMLLLAWVGKFFVVLIVMLFYEYHYGLDSIQYHLVATTGHHQYYPGVDFRDDMIPSFQPMQTSEGRYVSGGSGTENFNRFVLMMAFVMGPFYHALKIGCAFVGLLGVWWFYRAVVVALGRPYPPAFYLLAFFPSIIFWSSILGKDPIQFFFIGLYAYGGAVWLVQGRLVSMLYMVVGILGGALLRPWMGAMSAVVFALAVLLGKSRVWQVSLVVLIFPFLVYFGSELIAGQIVDSPDMLLDYMQGVSEGVKRTSSTGSSGELVDVTSEGALGAAMPWIIFTGLFRPLPFDITNPFTALAAVENTVVVILALVAISRIRWAYLRDPLVLWPAIYSLTWAAFYGLVVMANFGAGVRYKLQTWPFLLMVIVCLAHNKGRAVLNSRESARKGLGVPMEQGQSSGS